LADSFSFPLVYSEVVDVLAEKHGLDLSLARDHSDVLDKCECPDFAFDLEEQDDPILRDLLSEILWLYDEAGQEYRQNWTKRGYRYYYRIHPGSEQIPPKNWWVVIARVPFSFSY